MLEIGTVRIGQVPERDPRAGSGRLGQGQGANARRSPLMKGRGDFMHSPNRERSFLDSVSRGDREHS